MSTSTLQSTHWPAETRLRVVGAPHSEPRAWKYRVEELLDRIAPSDMPVLIQGETGSGKEVIARKIHARSARRGKPFIKINCAALPSELIESELFGYEKGAFTGAVKNNPGKFALADGGTVFLDEIGDMDFRLQAKLLQVLQDSEYIPLGAREVQKVDVRVIAATHRDLQGEIEEGRFREDLYYRLDVINIYVPPLRMRQDEVLDLARLFLHKHASGTDEIPTIPPHLADRLIAYRWPGNVRELEHIMKRLLVFRDSELIVQHLDGVQGHNERVQGRSAATGNLAVEPTKRVIPLDVEPRKPAGASRESLDEIKRTRVADEARVIIQILESTRWNRKRAAVALKMEYKSLLYKMKKLGIDARVEA